MITLDMSKYDLENKTEPSNDNDTNKQKLKSRDSTLMRVRVQIIHLTLYGSTLQASATTCTVFIFHLTLPGL